MVSVVGYGFHGQGQSRFVWSWTRLALAQGAAVDALNDLRARALVVIKKGRPCVEAH